MRAASRALSAGLAALALLAGCQRRPRFVERAPDPLALTSADSMEAFARRASDLWDRAGDRASVNEASAASAAALRAFLALRGGPVLGGRVAAWLDSLGMGAEVAMDRADSQLVAVNFFSRTNPEAGSDPYLFWRERSGVRAHSVEGRSLRLFQLASRRLPGREVALLFGRPALGGFAPLVLVHRIGARGDRFDLVQTVGTDSLGGVGRAEFAWEDTSRMLRARTWRPNPQFEECASCPHVFRRGVFAWGQEGFRRVSEEVEPSPYQGFVEFVSGLAEGDGSVAFDHATESGVVYQARQLGWDRPGLPWRLAPGGGESREVLVFYRGPQEAYRVTLALHDGLWLVSAIEPTERMIE